MTPLRTLWTRCMGGRRGCPRRWFFPGIAGLYLLLVPLILLYVELAFKLGWGVTRGIFFTIQALTLVPLPLLSTPAGLAGVAAMDAATAMEAGAIMELAPAAMAEIALFAVLTCALLLLLVFLYALVLLRLRDAGKSPLHLLAGCLPALGLLLTNVTMWSLPLYWTGLAGGSLWLFIVYCLPGRRGEQREDPADSEPAADDPFRGIERVACIGFLLLQFGLMLLHGCEPGTLLPLFLCVGALPAILLLFPGKGGGSFWPRGLALVALYLIFIPFQFFAWYALSSDALGIIIVFIAAPLVHTLWLLFAAPWFYRRLRRA